MIQVAGPGRLVLHLRQLVYLSPRVFSRLPPALPSAHEPTKVVFLLAEAEYLLRAGREFGEALTCRRSLARGHPHATSSRRWHICSGCRRTKIRISHIFISA